MSHFRFWILVSSRPTFNSDHTITNPQFEAAGIPHSTWAAIGNKSDTIQEQIISWRKCLCVSCRRQKTLWSGIIRRGDNTTFIVDFHSRNCVLTARRNWSKGEWRQKFRGCTLKCPDHMSHFKAFWALMLYCGCWGLFNISVCHHSPSRAVLDE